MVYSLFFCINEISFQFISGSLLEKIMKCSLSLFYLTFAKNLTKLHIENKHAHSPGWGRMGNSSVGS